MYPYTLDRLREIEVNFVFLRAGAVRGYCPRAKNEKRRTAVRISNPYRCFFVRSLRQNGTAKTPSPTKENAMLHTFILAWFTRLYRQSEAVGYPTAFLSVSQIFINKNNLDSVLMALFG